MLRDNFQPDYGNSEQFFQNGNGVLTYFDPNRNLWLSVNRSTLTFGINHNMISGKRFMTMVAEISSNNSGYVSFRSGIITAISAHCKESVNTYFRIIKNNDLVNDYLNIYMDDQISNSTDNLTVNFSNSDVLQCLIDVDPGSYVSYPTVQLEIAWT